MEETGDHNAAPIPRSIDHGFDRFLPLIPVALAVLLCWPGFRLPFLFDDYDFLYRAGIPGWAKFLPDPAAIFYRPVSREGYFGLLSVLGASPFVGHILNFGLLAAAILLLYAIVDRLLGRFAAQAAATLFAVFGQVPVLLAWISGCQDLLAIDFLLLALWFQLGRRPAAAVGAGALALLSKEISIAAMPGLAAANWILGRERRSSGASALGFAGVALLWGAIHPATGILAARRFVGTGAAYIGLDNADRWDSLIRSALTLLNVPPPGSSPVWPVWLSLPVAICAALILAAWRPAAGPGILPEATGSGRSRVALLGIALGLPPLVLTSLLVRHWTPYYTVVPAVGVCMALAALVPTRPRPILPAVLCLSLILGAWTRGMRIGSDIPTEVNLFPRGLALKEVKRQFLALRSDLPDSAQVLVYVLGQDRGSIRPHMYRFKVLRQWYRGPSIEITRPELRLDSQRAEFLFWVGSDITVHEVDLATLLPRSLGHRADYLEHQRTLRAYARGLSDSGHLNRAVQILLRMPELREEYRNLDHRIAAMLLFKHDREREATEILASLPPLPRRYAVEAIVGYLAAPGREELPVAAPMRAFGLSADDPEALRTVLQALRALGAYRGAAAVGEVLLRLEPHDAGARMAIEEAGRTPVPDLLTVPTP